MSIASNEADTTADIEPIIDPLRNDKTSVDLDEVAPDVYLEPLSWKRWVKRALPFLIAAPVIGVALLVALVGSYVSGWYVLVLALLCIIEALMLFMSYREWWRWRHEPYRADPNDGFLYQYEARNKWLFLLGTPKPRTLHLDTAEYLPQPQTIWENYIPLKGFRHSCTVTFAGPTQEDAEYFSNISDFMYGERISAIILYRKMLDQRHQEQDLELQQRQARSSEDANELLASIDRRLEESNQLLGEILQAVMRLAPQPHDPAVSTDIPE